jgi:hypothetical protein
MCLLLYFSFLHYFSLAVFYVYTLYSYFRLRDEYMATDFAEHNYKFILFLSLILYTTSVGAPTGTHKMFRILLRHAM